MIKSMTGFGQGSAAGENFKVRVDIRTIYNCFLDIELRMSQELASLEVSLKKQIQGRLKRGRVDVTISVEQMRQAKFEINRPLVAGYLSALAEMKSEFNLTDEPSLELVAKLQGALQVSQSESGLDEALVAGVSEALEKALDSLTEMRAMEGEELGRELIARLSNIEKQVPVIEMEAVKLPEIYRERLLKRLQDVIKLGQIDETRLAQEVV